MNVLQSPLAAEVLRLLAEKGQTWLKERPIKEKRELNISGTDLLQLNQEKGAWIGRLLEQLALKVALGEIENDKALLLEEAKRIMNQGNGKRRMTGVAVIVHGTTGRIRFGAKAGRSDELQPDGRLETNPQTDG